MNRVPAPRHADHAVAQRRARAYRVENLKLDACRLCGGAVDDVDDVSLRCDCIEQRHLIEQRAQDLLERHSPNRARRDLASVIAP